MTTEKKSTKAEITPTVNQVEKLNKKGEKVITQVIIPRLIEGQTKRGSAAFDKALAAMVKLANEGQAVRLAKFEETISPSVTFDKGQKAKMRLNYQELAAGMATAFAKEIGALTSLRMKPRKDGSVGFGMNGSL